MLNIEEIQKGKTFINIKNGKSYDVLEIATHSEDFNTLVIYQDLYGNVWARPLGLFRVKFTTFEKHNEVKLYGDGPGHRASFKSTLSL